MIPKDKDILEAVEIISNTRIRLKDSALVSTAELNALLTYLNLAKSHLQASDELPCEMEWSMTTPLLQVKGFNECLSIVKPIVAKKDKEISELVEVLQCLYDEQNGAPLIKHQKDWEEAMNKAESALNKHKTINE